MVVAALGTMVVAAGMAGTGVMDTVVAGTVAAGTMVAGTVAAGTMVVVVGVDTVVGMVGVGTVEAAATAARAGMEDITVMEALQVHNLGVMVGIPIMGIRTVIPTGCLHPRVRRELTSVSRTRLMKAAKMLNRVGQCWVPLLLLPSCIYQVTGLALTWRERVLACPHRSLSRRSSACVRTVQTSTFSGQERCKG